MLGLSLASAGVRHRERGVECRYVLGEGYEIFRGRVVAGSDPSCDIVIDHPAVPARAAEFFALGHHFYHRTLPDGEPSRSGEAVTMGPFEVWVSWGDTVYPLPGDAAGLPVRFGARVGEAYRLDDRDPRVVEARRLASTFVTLHAVDAAWCQERVQMFWSALTWATTPRRSLEPGTVSHASSAADAVARYRRAWSALDARPFDRDAFAHVHRLDLWVGELVASRKRGCTTAAVLARSIDTSALPPALQLTVHEIAALHLATLDDDVSPARPLAALFERGFVPLALPGGEIVLCSLVACEVDPPDADPAGSTRDAVLCVERFDRASLVIREDDHGYERQRRCIPTGVASERPTATLEIAGRHHPLGTVSTFQVEAHQIVLGAATGDDAMFVRHADRSLWLHANRDILHVRLNGRSLTGDDAMPLFDGDVIEVEAHYYEVEDDTSHDLELTAIVHDRGRSEAR